MRNEPINSRDLPSSETGERERLTPQEAALAGAVAGVPAAPRSDMPVASAAAARKPRTGQRKSERDEARGEPVPADAAEEEDLAQAEGGEEPVQLAMLDQPAEAGAPAQTEGGESSGAGEKDGKEAGSGGGSNALLYALGGLALVGGGIAAAGGGGNRGGGNSGGTPADTTPPAAPTIALQTDTGGSNSDRVTSNGVVTVGNLETGATWEFSTNGGTSWTAGSGTSFTVPAGSYAAGAVQVRQKDAAGNVSAVGSIAGAVTVDATAPGAPVISQVAGDDIVNTADKAAGVTVSGTAEAGSQVVVTWGTTTKSVTAGTNGAWSTSFAAAEVPANGPSSITAQATDLAGNASGTGTRAVTVADTIAVTGQIVAGPVVAGNGLTVDLYSGTGTLLKSGIALSATGAFTTTLDINPGTVVVARVIDGNAAADYLDEATGAPKDLNGQLLAVGVVQGTTLSLNVNPLTTIAAIEAGLQSNGSGTVTVASATAANAAIAKAFGLRDIDILSTAVVPANTAGYDPANGLSNGEKIGALLAALSGLDAKNDGNVQATLDQLAAAVTVTGNAGSLGDAGAQALVDGASRADAAIGGNLQDAISNTVATGSSELTIAALGTDNIVNGTEAAALQLTGTVAEGATGVALKIGDSTVAAQINGTSWSYAFTAADREALGADGVKLIKAEATLAGGGTSSASRAFVLDTTGPAAPTLAAIATDNTVNNSERTAGVVLSGTAGAGSTVNVTWGNAARTTTAGADGAWTATFASGDVPADAVTTVSVVALDGNGNASAATTRQVTVDTVAAGVPTIGLVAGNDIVGVTEAQAGVSVSGTVEANATVNLTWGATTKSVTADAAGVWSTSFALAELPADGATRISATQTDAVGNVSAAGTRDVRVAKAPTLPIVSAVTGDDRVNLIEASDGLTVSGVAAPNSQILINWGGVLRTTTTNANGDWSALFGIADLPADGPGSLTVTASTASGVLIGSVTKQVTLDTTAPGTPTLAIIAQNDVVNAAEKQGGLTLSGVGEANATVEVAWGSLIKTATVGANGTWSIQLPTAEVPADGTRKVSVTQLDAAGNRSTGVERNVIIDTEVPDAPTIALLTDSGVSDSDGLSRVGTVAVAGLAAGTTWEYSLDRGQSWEPGTGNSLILSEGEYLAGDLRVRQTDSAGNVSAVAANASKITIDQTVPDIGFDSVTTNDIVNAAEKNAGVVVTGQSEALSTVTVAWGGEAKTVKADAEGVWSVRFEKEQIPSDGTTTITATAVDLAGNQVTTPVAAPPVVVDTSAPSAPQLVLAADTGLSGSDRITSDGTIGLTGLENDADWQFSLNGGATWQDGSGTSFELVAGSYQSDQVKVRQFDVAGNVSSAGALGQAVTVDTSAAAPVIDAVAVDNIVNAPERTSGVTVTGSAEPNASVQLSWAGVTKTVQASAEGVWSARFDTSDVPADGSTSIEAVQTDAAGNVSLAKTQAVTVDTAAPAMPTIAQVTANGSVNLGERDAGVTVQGTAAPNADVVVKWGAAEKTVKAQASGVWTAPFTSAEIPGDGTTTVTAYQINGIGNPSATTSLSVVVDTVANAPVINSVATDNTVNAAERAAGVQVSGTAEAGSTVEIQWGTTIKTATANASGVWSETFKTTEVPGEGTRTLTATMTDVVGNKSVAAEASITVDTIAPGTPTISAIAADDIVTSAERGNGVTVSGAAEAGSKVRVTWGGASREVTASSTGTWTTGFDPAELPANGDFAVSAVATDTAGNMSSAAARVVAVSDASASTPVIAAVTTDNIVNNAEKTTGVRVNGVAPPSSTVTLSWGDVTKTITSTASGNWTASFAASEIPADGDRLLTATVNGVTGTRLVKIDTTAPAAPTLFNVATNNIINAAEKEAGIVVAGSAGASDIITLTWGGVTKTAVADTNGAWSTTFASADVPSDEPSTLSARAADSSGNIGGTATASLIVDTAAPAAPTLSDVTGDNVVSGAERTSDVTVAGTGEAGAKIDITWQGITKTVDVAGDGSWSTTFAPSEIVTSGTTTISLVQRDPAGNASSTLTRSIEVGAVAPESLGALAPDYIADFPIGSLDFDGFSAGGADLSGMLAGAGFGDAGQGVGSAPAPIVAPEPQYQPWINQNGGGQTVI